MLLDKKRLRQLRNTVFAKYGKIFKNEKLNKWFSKKKWYSRNPFFKENMLNETDGKNIDIILQVEKKRK